MGMGHRSARACAEMMPSSEGLRDTAGVTYLGSNEKAKRELGYAPRSLEDECLPSALDLEMEQAGVMAAAR